MIEELLAKATDPTAEPELRRVVDQHIRKLQASDNRGDRQQVAAAEAVVRTDPHSAFICDASGNATLTAGESCWNAGYFETPSIGELRMRAASSTSQGTPSARLWVFDGASPATDIGGLQATTNGQPLFQVASQFNCLESPGPYLARVADYFSDYTQGPRASISAFPATLLRHYAAPNADGGRFMQGNGRQIDLLADAFQPQQSPVSSGYLTGHGGMGAKTLAAALESRFEHIRVGLHTDAQVVLGYDWDGAVDSTERRIAQVFTSTVAAGGYGGGAALGAEFVPVARQLLRAAYLGTMLAGITHNCTPVVLTLIGGGVFGNPVELIWESILWAFDEAKALASGSFDVILNGHNLGSRVKTASLLPAVSDRGGAIIRFNSGGLVAIER